MDPGLHPASAHESACQVNDWTASLRLTIWYCFGNYCSGHLQDAVTYARLVAKRALYTSGGNRLTCRERDGDRKPPDGSGRSLMALPGVSFDVGRHVYQGFHDDRLADAVAYSRFC